MSKKNAILPALLALLMPLILGAAEATGENAVKPAADNAPQTQTTMSNTDLEKSEAAMFSELDKITEKLFKEQPNNEAQAGTENPAPKDAGIKMEDIEKPLPEAKEITVPSAPDKKENMADLEKIDKEGEEPAKETFVGTKAPDKQDVDIVNEDLVNSIKGIAETRNDILVQDYGKTEPSGENLPTGARFWESKAPNINELGKNVDKGLMSYDTDDGFIHTNVYIRLRDCISMGLEKNLGLTLERYNPEYYREGIRVAKGVFDPHLALSLGWEGADTPRPYVKVQSYKVKTSSGKVVNVPYNTKLHIGNTRNEGATYSLALSGKFATGLQYTLAGGFNRSWDNMSGTAWGNPLYGASTSVSLTMPILRGFGVDVNMAPVRVARNNWRIAKESLDDYMQTFITQIVEDYWTLYYWREQTGSVEYNLELTKNLLYVTSNKRAVGLVASNEVIQAQARIASQEQILISARNSIRDSEDNLRYIINFQMNDLYRPKAMRPYQYHLVPLEKPQVTDVSLDEADLIETAMIKRKTLEVAKLQLKNAKENLKVAKSNLMPKLDAVVNAGMTGIGNTPDRAFTDESSGNHLNWGVGMNFVVPFFFWDGVGGYRQAKYTKQKADLNVENVQQAIVIEVRTAIRAVQTNRKRITAARESSRLAYEQLYYEQEKYKAGLVTTYEVLQLQSDLATALAAEIKALVDWRISLSELARAVGLALDYNDVVIDDYYKLPKMEESYFTRFLWQ